MEKWVNSFGDDHADLKQLVLDNYIVTGGAITSMLLGEQPNDFDVYFRTADVAAKVAQFYVNKLDNNDAMTDKTVRVEGDRVSIYIKSAGIAGTLADDQEVESYEYFEMSQNDPSAYIEQFTAADKGKFELVYATSNALTLTDGVQIVLRFTGEPEQIHQNYDFVHCTNWCTEKELVFRTEALEATLAKELRYNGSKYPICSMFRIKKFIKRGWTISAGTMLKIAWEINDLNLNDVRILQDQLTGVDAAYFAQLIDAIKKENKPIEKTYIFELVNRIFDDA